MKKKFLIALLTATMLTMTACGSDSSDSAASGSDIVNSHFETYKSAEKAEDASGIYLGWTETMSSDVFPDASKVKYEAEEGLARVSYISDDNTTTITQAFTGTLETTNPYTDTSYSFTDCGATFTCGGDTENIYLTLATIGSYDLVIHTEDGATYDDIAQIISVFTEQEPNEDGPTDVTQVELSDSTTTSSAQ